MGTLIYLIIIASAAFVYWDATKNRIGKTSDAKILSNSPVWLWALGVLLIWIVAFPLYLVKRKELIQKALENPVEVPMKQMKLVFGVLGMILVIVLVGGLFGGENKAPSPFPNIPIPSLAQAQSDPLIQAAKDAVFDKIDPSMTIGDAIDNYPFFKKVTWTSRKEGGRKIVEATCSYRTDTKAYKAGASWFNMKNSHYYGNLIEATCKIRFTVNPDGNVSFKEFFFDHKCTKKQYNGYLSPEPRNGYVDNRFLPAFKSLYLGDRAEIILYCR